MTTPDVDLPPLPTLDAAYAMGYKAAGDGIKFSDGGCPFCWQALSAAGVGMDDFNQYWRPVMNRWFDGWSAYLKEHGLGFDLKPHGPKYGKPRNS